MSRRRKRYQKETMAEVNMTNLIDVCMVLLIVYILASNFVQTGLNISLPEVRYADSIGEQKIVVGIDLNNNLTVNAEPIAHTDLPVRLKDLKAKYPEENVYVQVDKMALTGETFTVFSAVVEAGFKSVVLPANVYKPKSE